MRPAAVEHKLVGTINPRCARCHRTLIDIVTRPTILGRAQTLPFDQDVVIRDVEGTDAATKIRAQ